MEFVHQERYSKAQVGAEVHDKGYPGIPKYGLCDSTVCIGIGVCGGT